jgi:hypothetical protein
MARFTLRWVFLGGLGLGTLIGACDRDDRAMGTERRGTDTDRRETISQDSMKNVVQTLAQVRCEREERCNNVGPDGKYVSRESCVSKLAAEKYDDLNLSQCPGGLDQKELGECLAEIRNEDCNSPLDTLGRLAACRSSDLCNSHVR